MKVWKRILGLVLATVMVVALAACGGKSDTKGGGSEDGTTLTFWTFGDTHAEYFESAVTSWNKLNPDKKIILKAEVLPFQQMHQNLQVAIQAGTGAPDLVDVEIQKAGTFLNVEEIPFEPLDAELESYKENLVQSRLDNFTVNGKIYGVDYHVGTMVMFYNTKILKEAGVDYKSIVTWDDFVEAGKVVYEKTGKWMTEVETSNAIAFDGMTSQQGEDYTSDGSANLSNQASIRALEFLQDLVYKHKIARPLVGGEIDSEEFYAEMGGGNVASIMAPAWYMGRFVNLMPDLKGDIELAPLPIFEEGNNRSSSWGGTGTLVTSQSKNKELAREFAVWAKADFNQAIKQWTELGFDPVRSDVWDSEEMLKNENPFVDYFGTDIFKLLKDLQEETRTVKLTAENAPIVREYLIVNVFPNVISEDTKKPKDALKAADAELKTELGK